MDIKDYREYYNSLSTKEQFIMNLVAVKASGLNANVIQRMAFNVGENRTVKEIDNFLKILYQKKFVRKRYTWQDEYEIDSFFMIHIFPLINNVSRLIAVLPERTNNYYFHSSLQEYIREMLYALLYENVDKYREKEADLLRSTGTNAVPFIISIIENDDYSLSLNKFSPFLFSMTFYDKTERCLVLFKSLAENRSFIERFESYLKKDEISIYLAKEYYFSGQIDKALEQSVSTENELISYFLPAIKLLLEEIGRASCRERV